MNRPSRLPTIEQVVGGSIGNWLADNGALAKLLNQGYVELPLNPKYLETYAPRLYGGLDYVIERADAFGVDPKHFRCDEVDEQIECGLMRRMDDEYKWMFHVTPGLESELGACGTPLRALAEFFPSVYELNRAAWTIACVLAAQFDALFHRSLHDSMAARFQNGYFLSRLLDYLSPHPARSSHGAKPHTDRSGFTFHWLSTHPGLKLWNGQNRWVSVNETDYGTLLIFLGRKFSTLTQGRWSFGTFHAVEDRRTFPAENRRAIVSFIHPTLTGEEVAWHLKHKAAGSLHALPHVELAPT